MFQSTTMFQSADNMQQQTASIAVLVTIAIHCLPARQQSQHQSISNDVAIKC